MGSPIAQELERAQREGVTVSDNAPFWLSPPNGRGNGAGLLLVHGFTASPWEMRGFGEALRDEGFLSYGVRLAGHGTSASDLAQRSWEEWLESVAAGYRLLLEHRERVYGIGMSTGALLLLALATSAPMAGAVLLSPYLRLRHRLAPATRLLRHLIPYQPHPLRAELQRYYYPQRPVAGVYQLTRLCRALRRQLDSLTLPVLSVSALGDRTVDLPSAIDLFRRLGSTDKELHLFGPEVPHVLTTGENPRRTQTLALTRDFLLRREGLHR